VTSATEQTAELVGRARAGDARARETLFRAHAPVALRLSLSLTRGNLADAEDLTQDAFIKVFNRLDDLRVPAHFGGWLLKTVRNLGINRYRSNQSRERSHERAAAQPRAPETDPFAALEQKERAALLQRALERTPDGELKETARLFYLEGLDSTQAVAERMNVPKSTVTTRLDRFRRGLRKTLLAEIARNCRADRTEDIDV
jgi:RNA polymerase sigma-70 factor (ECF subfamily)